MLKHARAKRALRILVFSKSTVAHWLIRPDITRVQFPRSDQPRIFSSICSLTLYYLSKMNKKHIVYNNI